MISANMLTYFMLLVTVGAIGGLCTSCVGCEQRCEVPVRIDSGVVCGRVRCAEDGSRYVSYRGIPYGKPPTGDRRFKELEPVDPWHGTKHATEDGPACPQKDILYGRMVQYLHGMSEDCIYLNIHVPLQALRREGKPNQGRGLPILVMIHGGGFHSGSGLTDMHGPEYLMTKNVIVVTFNYRINVFGFLSLKTSKIPGNQALRDQLTLLRWVQRHACSFGGDPGNVALMGQSAGATTAHILSLSKAAQGLFHKLILLSGTALPNFYTSSPIYEKELSDGFLKLLNLNSSEPDVIHRRLVKMPLVDIMFAHNRLFHDFGRTFVPVVEDEYPGITRILDNDALELIAQGRGKKYPLLIGFTNKEEEFFRQVNINNDILKRIQENPTILLTDKLAYQYTENQLRLASMVSERYFNGTPTLDKYLVLVGDKFFRHPAIRGALWSAMAGTPTYLYQYSYESKKSLIGESLWTPYKGAAHVEDLTYIFKVNSMIRDYFAYPPKNKDDLMKDWMTTIVTNFMKCSTPTCSEDQSGWPPLSPDHIEYQSIEDPMVLLMRNATPDLIDMVDFFDNLDDDYRRVTERLKKTYRNQRINTK